MALGSGQSPGAGLGWAGLGWAGLLGWAGHNKAGLLIMKSCWAGPRSGLRSCVTSETQLLRPTQLTAHSS